MKIVGFASDSGPRLGLIEGEEVVDLCAADPRVPGDLGSWLVAHDGDLAPLAAIAARAPAAARRPLAGLAFGLPVARPGKIICLGLNYLEHAKEGGHQKPEFPSIFMRCLTSLVPHQSPIIRPAASETLDYEAELVIVIGRRTKHATLANASPASPAMPASMMARSASSSAAAVSGTWARILTALAASGPSW